MTLLKVLILEKISKHLKIKIFEKKPIAILFYKKKILLK